MVENTTENILEDFDSLTYKNTKVLSNYLSDQGKILPRRVTGLSSKQQKKVTKLIKTARIAALLPFVTVVALSLPGILGGSAIIEQVFNYPGVGNRIVQAALFFDMPVILAINTFFGFMSIFMLLVAEIIYAIVDPRVKF